MQHESKKLSKIGIFFSFYARYGAQRQYFASLHDFYQTRWLINQDCHSKQSFLLILPQLTACKSPKMLKKTQNAHSGPW